MKKILIRSMIAVGVLVGLLALVWISGNRDTVDEIEAASAKTGIAFESEMIAVGDLRLHVALAGPRQGPKVILLHGYPEFWYTWHAQMASLARAGFRVAAPDMRGTNRSDKPTDPAFYTGWHLADDVIGILDALGWQKAFLAGHDVGGGTAWQLVFDQPERFHAAMIFNTAHPSTWSQIRPEDDDESVSWFRTFFQIPFLPELVGRAGDWWLLSYYLRTTSRPGAFGDEEMALYKSSWARDRASRTMINTYRAPNTPIRRMTADGRPTIPVRIIWGDRDAFIPLAGARLRDLFDLQRLNLPARIVPAQSYQAGVDHVPDARDSYRCLRHVGGQHDAAIAMRLEQALLLGERQARENRQHFAIVG